MNENLDLTEILKDCPKGTKFYSSTFGNVEFLRIEKDDFINPIVIKWVKEEGNSYIEYLTKEGKFRGLGECIIFPSKDQRDWSKWHRPFVDGDVIVGEDYIGLYETYRKGNIITYCSIDEKMNFILGEVYCYFGVERFATEEEKQKFFDAIKANGYKWNAEIKILEKLIVPKFKVGDKVRNKANGCIAGTIIALYKEVYEVKNPLGNEFSIDFISQDRFELVPNKFDPKTLQPFDKLLARHRNDNIWYADFFSNYNEVGGYAVCAGGVHYSYCIPYNEDTKHLAGKSDEAPEFYRYWED